MTKYNPAVPTGTVPLNIDYQNLQNNFQQLDTTYGVDHVAYSVASQNGYHKNLHMISVSTVASNAPNNQPVFPPVTTNAFGQLFSAQTNDGYDTDEVLNWLSGGGKNIQLTSNFVPVAAVKGVTMLPGGLTLQWGKITAAGGNAIVPVTFTGGSGVGVQNYPNNNFGVWTTIASAGSSVNAIYIPAVSITGFSYQNTSTIAKDFYWISIGN